MKNGIRFTIALVIIKLCLLSTLQAQQSDTSSYFPLGLWGIWIDGRKAPYSRDLTQNEWNNERTNWRNIKGNYLVYHIPYWVQDTVMAFADSNEYKMDIANFHYQSSDHPTITNSLYYWMYYSPLSDSAQVTTIINNIKTTYCSHQGFYNYTFGQEGPVNEPTLWPKVELISRKIHELDPQRKSYMVSGEAPPTGFIDATPRLDILQMDVYRLYENRPQIYSGQQQSFDELLYHYNLTMNRLKGKHAEWQVIIQAQRENRSGGCTNLRRPNIYELRAQAYLALSRGSRGVTSFVYGSYISGLSKSSSSTVGFQPQEMLHGTAVVQSCSINDYIGLVDDSRDGYNHLTDQDGIDAFANLATVHNELKSIGSIIRKLKVTDAFANTSIPSNTASIASVSGDKIEIGAFQRNDQVSNPANYFMLVNRVCNNQDGSVSSPQNVTVTFALPSGSYEIEEVKSHRLWVIPNTGNIADVLNPGEGKLYKIGYATWSGNKNILFSTTVASGATLTAMPGAVINSAYGVSLTVNGTLNAQGTSSSPITFTSTGGTTPGSWGSIIINGTNSSANLGHITMQYGTMLQFIYGANATIQNSTILKNIYGVYVYCAGSLIADNSIIDPSYRGMACTGAGLYSTIYNNVITKTVGGGYYKTFEGINFGYHTYGYLYHNDIKGFNWGMFMGGQSTATFSDYYGNMHNPNNRIRDCNIGLGAFSGSAVLMQNDFAGYNSIDNNPYEIYACQNSYVLESYNYYGGGGPVVYNDGTSTIISSNPLTYDPWPPSLGKVSAIASTGLGESGTKASVNGLTANTIQTSTPQTSDNSSAWEDEKEIEKGRKLERQKYIAGAIGHYKQMIKSNKMAKQALAELARIGNQNTNTDLIAYFESLKDTKKPYEAYSMGLLSGMYLRQGAVEKCSSVYDEIIAKFPNTLDERIAWFEKFYFVLHVRNDKKAAAELLDKIISKYSKDDLEGEIEFAQFILNPSTKMIKDVDSTIKKESTLTRNVPKEGSLSENYPNPFNPTTVINYQISSVSNVSLKVYDILGREVAKLADGIKDVGSYTATFDGAKLSSGIYFARMTVRPQDGSKPIVLIRKMLLTK